MQKKKNKAKTKAPSLNTHTKNIKKIKLLQQRSLLKNKYKQKTKLYRPNFVFNLQNTTQ